jgi:hypothetical protein
MGAEVTIVEVSAFTFARDRCVEQLDQIMHLIIAGREWTLTSLNFRATGIWGNLRNMQAAVDEPTVSHHAMT